jgi:hypothetical protein
MVHQESLLPVRRRRAVSPAGSGESRLAARLLARVGALALDRRLIAGEDPASSALLAARAARLTGPRYRESLAVGLEALLGAARRASGIARISPDRSAVLANELAIRTLAGRLKDRAPVCAPGVARLERLLTDSTGPAFRGGAAALAGELARAAAALDGTATGDGSQGPSAGSSPRRRPAIEPRPDPAGFVGSSFTLPDGSWFHGRRDSS